MVSHTASFKSLYVIQPSYIRSPGAWGTYRQYPNLFAMKGVTLNMNHTRTSLLIRFYIRIRTVHEVHDRAHEPPSRNLIYQNFNALCLLPGTRGMIYQVPGTI